MSATSRSIAVLFLLAGCGKQFSRDSIPPGFALDELGERIVASQEGARIYYQKVEEDGAYFVLRSKTDKHRPNDIEWSRTTHLNVERACYRECTARLDSLTGERSNWHAVSSAPCAKPVPKGYCDAKPPKTVTHTVSSGFFFRFMEWTPDEHETLSEYYGWEIVGAGPDLAKADHVLIRQSKSAPIQQVQLTKSAETLERIARDEADDDGDGVANLIDRCDDEPEDKDGVEDSDGCPETTDAELQAQRQARDLDRDGIETPYDKCPGAAEDMNGWQDRDGCPEGGPPDLSGKYSFSWWETPGKASPRTWDISLVRAGSELTGSVDSKDGGSDRLRFVVLDENPLRLKLTWSRLDAHGVELERNEGFLQAQTGADGGRNRAFKGTFSYVSGIGPNMKNGGWSLLRTD